MVKSKVPVYYCKFCDEVLKTDCQFCSQPCRNIWMKTRNTLTEQLILNKKKAIELLKQNRIDISESCKDIYETLKKFMMTHTAVPSLKAEASLCCYIYNKNREKAFQTFEKFKRYSQDELDACLFEGRQSTIVIHNSDGISTQITGDEAVRVDGIMIKLSVERYHLMLQQTFS